jgi:hypothetical protein
MSYTKMTTGDFISKLENGGYKTSTAAKRAVGKAKFNDAGKDKCYKAIGGHFGETSKAPPKKSKGAKKSTSKKKTPAAKSKARNPAPPGQSLGLFNQTELALQELEIAKQQVGTIVQAIQAMKSAKEAYPDLDTKGGAEVAQAALTGIMQGVHAGVRAGGGGNGVDPNVAKRFQQSSGASVGLPGQDSPAQPTTDDKS